MCGRYACAVHRDIIIDNFDIETSVLPEFGPGYNIAPQDRAAVITHYDTRLLLPMTWGYVPSWTERLNQAEFIVNVRSENLSDPFFKASFIARRCAIPATGYYEWRYSTSTKRKYPYYISPKNQDVFCFAGIYTHWMPEDKKNDETYPSERLFAIVTTRAHRDIRFIHGGMPVIFSAEEVSMWLDPQSNETQLKSILKPYADDLIFYMVTNYVNNPKNDGKQCLETSPKLDVFNNNDEIRLDDYF